MSPGRSCRIQSWKNLNVVTYSSGIGISDWKNVIGPSKGSSTGKLCTQDLSPAAFLVLHLVNPCERGLQRERI